MGRPVKYRRTINFDLNRKQIIEYFGNDEIYHKIRKFMEINGFRRVQQSGYESVDPK